MRLIEKELGDFSDAIIIPISDSHIGARQFNEEKFKNMISFIDVTANAYCVLLGDLVNNGLKNSKTDVYTEVMNPHEQKKKAISLLSPIKHKILGATSGNHEERSWKEAGADITEDIADALGVPYDPFGLLINAKVGRYRGVGQVNYTIYGCHGFGGGGTKGAKLNKLYSLKDIVLADVYLMGHLHDVITTSDMYFVPDTRHSRVVEHERYFAMAGSSLNWGGYSERMLLRPSKTSFPVIRLDGTKRQVNITI